MQFFNTTLARTMFVVHLEPKKEGFVSQGKQWIVTYVDGALVGSSTPAIN